MLLKHILLLTLVAYVAAESRAIAPSETITVFVARRAWKYYYFTIDDNAANWVKIETNVDSGTAFYYTNINSPPTFTNNTWKYEDEKYSSMSNKFLNPTVNRKGVLSNSVFYIGIYGYTDVTVTLTVSLQGLITLYEREIDKQVIDPAVNQPNNINSYIFYQLKIDRNVRSFQAVVRIAKKDGYNTFSMGNSTTTYPAGTNYQYHSTTVSTEYTCLYINMPPPGTYRLGVAVKPSGKYSGDTYSIQWLENSPQTCAITNKLISIMDN